MTLKVLAALAVVSLLGCSDGHSVLISPHLRSGEVAVQTPERQLVYAPADEANDPAFPDALREIDVAQRLYAWAIEVERMPVALVRFIHHEDDDIDAARARYVGDGVIEACLHANQFPRLFCYSEALGDLARDRIPGKTEEQHAVAEGFARDAIFRLYRDRALAAD